MHTPGVAVTQGLLCPEGFRVQTLHWFCVLVTEQPSVSLTANMSWVTGSFLCALDF